MTDTSGPGELSGPEELDVSLTALGSKHKNRVVRYLAGHDLAQLNEIRDATSIPVSSLSGVLRELEELGLIEVDTDLPIGRRKGMSVSYSLNAEAVAALQRKHTAYLLRLDEAPGPMSHPEDERLVITRFLASTSDATLEEIEAGTGFNPDQIQVTLELLLRANVVVLTSKGRYFLNRAEIIAQAYAYSKAIGLI